MDNFAYPCRVSFQFAAVRHDREIPISLTWNVRLIQIETTFWKVSFDGTSRVDLGVELHLYFRSIPSYALARFKTARCYT